MIYFSSLSKYCTYLKLFKQIYISTSHSSFVYLKSFCSSIEHMALFNRIKKKKKITIAEQEAAITG